MAYTQSADDLSESRLSQRTSKMASSNQGIVNILLLSTLAFPGLGFQNHPRVACALSHNSILLTSWGT